MKTLFIDSSRKSLTVALYCDNKLLFVSNVDSKSKHSNFLVSEIKKIIEQSNFKINDIDNIIVLNGPGSFTGIRVGVTVAKTLAWALNKKLYLVNNLEALSLGLESDIVISVIYDKQNDSYVGLYEKENKVEEYLNIDYFDKKYNNKKITIVSMDENLYIDSLKDKLNENNVEIKIISEYNYEELLKFALNKSNINPHLAEPIYLKKIDAEK